uniref:Adhesin domain-containing protein n=1 Tax=Anolis carolinensis TaxID=28377 RepID=G1KFA6_ANOCA
MMLLPLLPRCWHLAAGIPARNWLLTGGGGFAGQEAWSGTCQLLPRLLWTSPGSRSPDPSQPTEPRPETKETLKEWALAVCPFGSLKAHLPCHVTLCPLDPHKHPNGDRIFVTAKAASTKTCHPRSGLDSLKVKYDEGLKEVSIISSDVDGAASVDVRMPVKFGDTTLQTKTGNITVDSADGSLKASTIQGEIDVYVVSRLGDVELKSENGAVSVKVPATLNADLHLSGSKVEVSPEIHWQDIQKVSREGRIIVTGEGFSCVVFFLSINKFL